MVRFLHSSDWQLGMTRHFLASDAQARFTQARLEAIEEMGRIAAENECEFVVVAGDVFESNLVDRKTVSCAIEALKKIRVPVFLLPGNHDALDAGSVYKHPAFTQRRPPHVRVLADSSTIEVRPGVEVLGAPWTSKRPLRDLVAEAGAPLRSASGRVRILVAHGAVEGIFSGRDDPAAIQLRTAEAMLAQGSLTYLALGDHHSTRTIGSSGAIWYSGTPESTDYDEERPGNVLLVEIEERKVRVTPCPTGTWRFLRQSFELGGEADVAALEAWIEDFQGKENTVLKLILSGSLPLRLAARMEAAIDHARDVFAAIEDPDRHRDLALLPDDEDFSSLDLSGFAKAALQSLRARAASVGEDAAVARDALALLLRLSRKKGA